MTKLSELEDLAERLYKIGSAADETDDFKWNARPKAMLAIAAAVMAMLGEVRRD